METTLCKVRTLRASTRATHATIADDGWADPTGRVLNFSVSANVDEEFWERLYSGTEILIIDERSTIKLAPPVAPLHCRNLFSLSITMDIHISTEFVLCLPPHFSELYVNYGSVDEHGVDFSSLTCLTHLSLSACDIGDISGVVFPDRAFYLDLSHNKIDLSRLCAVDKILGLSLCFCTLRGLERFEFPSSLRELDLSYTGMSDISNMRGLPPRLRYLDLSGNQLHNLDGWECPQSLVDVHMGHNKFEDFPRLLIGSNLKTLGFTFNPIADGDIYPLLTQIQHYTNGDHVFIAAIGELTIHTGLCKLSSASEALTAAIEKARDRGGLEEANHYLHAVTAMVALRSASHVPVAEIPVELCMCLFSYLYIG